MNREEAHKARKWAELRFATIGELLASPPEKGDLYAALKEMAEKEWQHPISGKKFKVSVPTQERWYYRAKNANHDMVSALVPKKRSDTGTLGALPERWLEVLNPQYKAHKRWTWQLHYDNLVAWIKKSEPTAKPPSYSTVRRYMKSRGMFRSKKPFRIDRPHEHIAEQKSEHRETRSYEVAYVGGLWHTDFHHARRRIVDKNGEWFTPIAVAIIDDRSRLCCHLQWFAQETAQTLTHSLLQGIMKRGIPRALMTDNGAAMATPEFREGLARLGIVHELTRTYSPEQNAKVEVFWSILESRLMAMLESVKDLTLAALNRHSTAWVEAEYNRHLHREIKSTPYERFLNDKSVLRKSPSHDDLVNAFRAEHKRNVRRSDGTITVDGVRYEIPERLRHMSEVFVRVARWNHANAHVVDPTTGKIVAPILPLDKTANASGMRKITPTSTEHTASDSDAESNGEIPQLLQDYVFFLARGESLARWGLRHDHRRSWHGKICHIACAGGAPQETPRAHCYRLSPPPKWSF